MVDYRDFGNSRRPGWEGQLRRIACKSHHFNGVLKNRKNRALGVPFEIWSGLSESNRHLNLGKVPYYHYTKAAQRLFSYNMCCARPTSAA
jgi:hypothetical protein